MDSRKLGRGRSAFTLIELLVVIGIIAVIAAILFPVFVGIRERGRQTQCLSNERQLGEAFLLYAQDSDGVMTPGAIASTPFAFWPQLVFPYVHSDAIPDRCQRRPSVCWVAWRAPRPTPRQLHIQHQRGWCSLVRCDDPTGRTAAHGNGP